MDAGGAKLAFRLGERRRRGPHDHTAVGDGKSQSFDYPDIGANSHAAGAADAEVVIARKQWVVLNVREITKNVARSIRFDADVISDPAQLAIRKLCATPLGHGNVEGTGDAVAAFSIWTG